MRINIVGFVSVGKSSVINSLIYLFSPEKFKPQASVAKRRETMNITEYILFEYNGDNIDMVKTEKEENNIIISNMQLPKLEARKRYISSDYNITLIDYPGLDDVRDNRDLMGALFENMKTSTITLFIIDANKPLINKYENDIYTKIKKRIIDLKSQGIYHKLFIVANKYDVEGEDFDEVFQSFQKKYYKWSAYNVLAQCKYEWSERKNYIHFKNPVNLELFNEIKAFDYLKKQFTCRRRYIIKELRGGRSGGILKYMGPYQKDRKIINLMINNLFKIGGFELPAYAFIEEEIEKYIDLDYKFHKDIWRYLLSTFIFVAPHKYKFKIVKYNLTEFKNKNLQIIYELTKIRKSEIFMAYNETRIPLNLPPVFKIVKFPIIELQELKIDVKKILDLCYINRGEYLTLSEIFG